MKYLVTLLILFFGVSIATAQTSQPYDAAYQALQADVTSLYNQGRLAIQAGTAKDTLILQLTATTQASTMQITQLTTDKASLATQLLQANAQIAALKLATPAYDEVVIPGNANALQTALTAVPLNGTVYVPNGHYVETPTIPRACKIIGQSASGVIIDAGSKAFTVTAPANTSISNVSFIGAVFGVAKPAFAALLITDNCHLLNVSATSDSVGITIRGAGGAGGGGITADNITTSNSGEEGLAVGDTRGCVINGWTSVNNFSPTSFNPKHVVYSAGVEGGAGKFAYNDGLVFKNVTVTDNPCNGPWFDTGNTNCVLNVTYIARNGMVSNPGGYAGLMIEQNDGTNSHLNTKGINGATVTINGGKTELNQNNDILIGESSGVVINLVEYHDQIGMRQMPSRASKIHNDSILNCLSYGSTYPDKTYTKTAADIVSQKITMDGTTYFGLPRTIGYWLGGTQTDLAGIQKVGLEKNGIAK